MRVCGVGVGKGTTKFIERFMHVQNMDNSDGVAKESIGDILVGFPNCHYIFRKGVFSTLGKICH